MAGPRLGRWEQAAVAVWLLLLLGIMLRGFAKPHSNTVYPIFAEAARHWLVGEDLYRPVGDPYRYSPLVAILLTPFTLLPDALGGVVWRLLNVCVYLGALVWWGRAVLPPLSRRQWALLFLLIVPLSVGSLNNAQSNALVLGLLLAGVAGAASERWNLASVCLGLACLFKLYPIAIGLLLAALYPRRLAGRLALSLVLGLAIPFIFRQPSYVLHQYAGWLNHLRTDDRQVLPIVFWYRDLRLLCHLYSIPMSATMYHSVQMVAAAGIAAICLLEHRAGWPQRHVLTALLGLGCCWMTLLGSATESCTYILLAPSLAWALLDRQPGWLRMGLVGTYALFGLTQAAVWFPWGREAHSLGLHPLAALAFLICLVAAQLWRLLEASGENGKPVLGEELSCPTSCS
jgi:hypothetical protein